ncbi:hypothetical protein ACIP5Y_11175 [Nocardia sp. NPDC088792]|uniref:hypothetical protein n=1 Tax=Nocardia sp. NPDC088792 TaxID=3364332 RepID=UPI00381D93EE
MLCKSSSPGTGGQSPGPETPQAPLTAVDRDRRLDLALSTLDPAAARRLDALTEAILTTPPENWRRLPAV